MGLPVLSAEVVDRVYLRALIFLDLRHNQRGEESGVGFSDSVSEDVDEVCGPVVV